jgi:hypothetical protein
MRKAILFSCLVLACLVTACGKKHEVLVWPEVMALDETVEKAEVLVDTDESSATLIQLAADLSGKTGMLLASSIPAGVKSPERVALRLQELMDLQSALADSSHLDKSHILAFHPVVEGLMEAAGMPHVHEKGHDHEHDHEH